MLNTIKKKKETVKSRLFSGKKTILALGTSVFISGAILTSCNTPAEKVENAQENVTQANEDLDKANKEYLADIENYKSETAAKIAANEKSIADFNARIEKEKKEARAGYKMKIEKLEQKNSDLKKEIADYKAEGKEKWQIFKTEFNHDMEELGEALKDFTVKNIK